MFWGESCVWDEISISVRNIHIDSASIQNVKNIVPEKEWQSCPVDLGSEKPSHFPKCLEVQFKCALFIPLAACPFSVAAILIKKFRPNLRSFTKDKCIFRDTLFLHTQ